MKYYYNEKNEIKSLETIHSIERLKELSPQLRNVDLYDKKSDVPTPEGYKLEGNKFVLTADAKKKKEKQDALAELSQIDSDTHADRTWREYVIDNAKLFNTRAVDRMKDAEKKAKPLRAKL